MRRFFAPPLFFFTLIVLVVCSLNVQAQPYIVKGKLVDTMSYVTMYQSSVVLVRDSDSIMEGFTRTNEEGEFSLPVQEKGTYTLILSHPMFADFKDQISVNENPTDLGEIQMFSKSNLLQEVIVSDSRAITIKGDTTEYTADSFKVREFANVDELLKRLPGIEVDKNGNITAHGEKVQKMYVDGEEFFSDDPAMVAKTLRASAVDKVQVYDKKSDQAEFTGIDDGEKIKTINLKLKENAKKGYFGKIAAGGGLQNYWESQVMLNAFKAKRKVSVYGTMSNTTTTGLNWDDSRKYSNSGGGTLEMSDDGSFTRTIYRDEFDLDSWNGQYNGQGLPKAWNAGAHYSNKWLNDALSFNGNYQFAKFDIETDNNVRTQYILPDTQYVNTNYTSAYNSRMKHNANLVSEYNFDSTTSLKLNVGGYVRSSESRQTSQSEVLSLNGDPINASHKVQDVSSNGNNFNANLLFRKKFKKEGRTLSINLNGAHTENDSKGNYNALNSFAAIGITDTVNQRKTQDRITDQIEGKASYTEQLSKHVAMELNYTLNVNNNQSANYTFNRAEDGTVSDVFDSLYSSDYSLNILTHTGGGNVRLKYERINITLGGAVANAAFRQYDKIADTTLSYNYLNFFPKAIFRYSRNRQTNFTLSYSGRTNQPTINQLQPIRENTDPLNILIGNPDLKQEFQHNLNLNFGNYKVLQERYLWASLGVNLSQNAISQSQNLNDLGQRTYQYVNVDGNYNLYGYAGYGFKIKPLNVRTNLSVNGGYSHVNTYLNGQKSTSINQNYGPGLSFTYNKDTLLDLNYSINVNYNRSTASVRPDYVNDYWSVNQNFGGSYLFPGNFILGTDVDWLYRQKIDELDQNNSVLRWNAYLSKSFLKDRSLVLKLYVNDILNQNVGFVRTASDNYITENSYNTIRRYGMLSLTWNFTRSGAMSKGTTEEDTSSLELE